MPARVVKSVEILFPPGPSGLVGVALATAGQIVIPYNVGSWIIGDGETVNWSLDGYIQSGAWSLRGYNLGTYAHTVYIRFLLDLPGAGQAQTILPIGAGQLSGVA